MDPRPYSSEDSGVETLKHRLYSRTDPPAPRARRALRPDDHREVPESWLDKEEAAENAVQKSATPPVQQRARRLRELSNVFTVLLGFSFVFFLASAGIAAYFFWGGANVVSSDNIDIEIHGPLSVPGGDALTLQLGVVNRNAVPLEAAALTVELPEGAREAGNVAEPLTRVREHLGVINPGERKKTSVQAVLLGEEGDAKRVRVVLEYRVRDSNAVFVKERTYEVVVSSAPVSLTVETLKEISAGQEIALRVKAVANASAPVKNVLITGDYPFGFQFKDANPSPTAGNNVWRVGDLAPGEVRELEVRGTLTGQDTEERIFRFAVGVEDEKSPTEIAAVFQQAEAPVVIKRPFLDLQLVLEGAAGTGDVVIENGRTVRGAVRWKNTLPDPLHEVEITATLKGNIFNRAAVEADDGFYRSQNHTILWNSQTARELARVEPSESGVFSFSFTPFALDPRNPVVNPEVVVEVSAKGRRLSERDVPEIIEASMRRKVIVASRLFLVGETLYDEGPFENTGPVPPRAEERTTYTLVLNVANSTNEVRDAKLVTRVPWYVEWLGNLSPENAAVRFNKVTGELVWDIGTIPAGTGYTAPPLQLMFQVALEPSLSQRGSEVRLLEAQSLRGVDAYTGVVLQTEGAPLTTTLTNDATDESGVVR